MRKAIVMAGGQGSRLWPLTLTRPKPLVPVVNRPVMAHILEWLRRHGCTEILVTLHYRADDIRRTFGDGRDFGLHLFYQVEEEPLGTAGSVKLAQRWINQESFLVVSGDALTDLDLTDLQRRHTRSGAWLTLGLKHVRDPSQYGVVQRDHRGRIVRFQEKPGPGREISHLANTGIYCVEPQVLEQIPTGRPYDWSRDVFPRLMAEERPLLGHIPNGYWCDIGTINDYRRGQRDALDGTVQVRLPGTELQPGVWVGPDVRVAPSARLEGPVLLGAGCRIEADAQVLSSSILGEQTIVRAGAFIRNATLGAQCGVGLKALVEECVIGEESQIGTGCSVSDGAVLGRRCCLLAGAGVGYGQRLGPERVICGPELLDTRSPGRDALGQRAPNGRSREEIPAAVSRSIFWHG